MLKIPLHSPNSGDEIPRKIIINKPAMMHTASVAQCIAKLAHCLFPQLFITCVARTTWTLPSKSTIALLGDRFGASSLRCGLSLFERPDVRMVLGSEYFSIGVDVWLQ